MSAAKIVLGVSGAMALAAAGISAYTATTPDWFHATYPDQDCPIGEIGLFSSNWDPENCAGLNPENETRISGPSKVMDTSEYWPLFPLQYPKVDGNPLQNITGEFVDCETSVEEVYTYVGGVLESTGLTALTAGFDGFGFVPTTDEGVLLAGFTSQFQATLPPGLTTEQIAAATAEAWATAYGAITVCINAGGAPSEDFLECHAFLLDFGARDNLGTAFNTDTPKDKATAIQLCEDDNVDHDNLLLCQKLVPAGAAMGGVAGIAAIVAAAALPEAAIIAALTSLGNGAMMMSGLLILKGTPAAAGVGGECTDPEKTCYTQEINGLLGLIVVILSALAAVGCIVGFILHKKQGSNQLVA